MAVALHRLFSTTLLTLAQASSKDSHRPTGYIFNEDNTPSNTRDRSMTCIAFKTRLSTKSSISNMGEVYHNAFYGISCVAFSCCMLLYSNYL